MKIALLARNPHLYSHRRICEAARARGHEIEVVNTLRVSINITSRRPALYYRKRRLEDFDAVIADRVSGEERVLAGLFLVAIDPAAFGDPDTYSRQVADVLDSALEVPPAPGSESVLVAGDPEEVEAVQDVAGRRCGHARRAADRRRLNRRRRRPGRVTGSTRRPA